MLVAMDQWLVEQYTFYGVTFQNWMTVALAVILIAVLIA